MPTPLPTRSLFTTPGAGSTHEANPRACESLGYTKKELLSLNLADIEQDLSPGGIRREWSRMSRGTAVTREGTYRRKNGTTFPVEIHTGPVEFDGRQAIFATVRDITARRKLEDNCSVNKLCKIP